MRKFFLFGVICLTAQSCSAMEQGIDQQMVEGPAKSLQDLCLEKIARDWSEIYKNKQDVFALCDYLVASNQFESFEKLLPKKPILETSNMGLDRTDYPQVISPDGRSGFYYGFKPNGYGGYGWQTARYDRQIISTIKENIKLCSSYRINEKGIFSLDGRWFFGTIGVSEKRFCCIDIESAETTIGKTTYPIGGHYAFLSSDRILFCDDFSLWICSVKYFLERRGDAGLTRIYTYADGEKYSGSLIPVRIAGFSDKHAVWIGSKGKSLEVISEKDAQWQCAASIQTSDRIEEICWARIRPLVVTIEESVAKTFGYSGNSITLRFYSVGMEDVHCCGALVVANLYHIPVFSSDETLLLYATVHNNSVGLIECSDPTNPTIVGMVSVYGLPYDPFWYRGHFYAAAGGMVYKISFDHMQYFIAAYKKKRVEEAHKKIITLSNNNNA